MIHLHPRLTPITSITSITSITDSPTHLLTPAGYPRTRMEKRGPERTCIGCRRKNSQALLIRVSRDAEGRLAPTSHTRTGRGAYICAAAECIDAALKGDRLARALRSKVTQSEKDELKPVLSPAP